MRQCMVNFWIVYLSQVSTEDQGYFAPHLIDVVCADIIQFNSTSIHHAESHLQIHVRGETVVKWLFVRTDRYYTGT
mgnify:FL=1